MVRTLPVNSETRPELPRILALAAAIAVHAFALLLLLIPMATPLPQIAVDDDPDVIWIAPEKKIVEEEVIERAKPKPVTHERTVEKTPDTVIPKHETPVIIDNGTMAAEAEPALTPTFDRSAATEAADTGPISVGSLGYITATPPPYPRVDARVGTQGTVMLKVLVGVDGKPIEVAIQQSSGSKSLDRSAREHVLKHWLFQPAMRDGKAVRAYGVVPVVFSMQ